MAELSRDEVVEVLGRLSDVILAEIIATGITKDELAAARERVEYPAARPRTLPRLADQSERSPAARACLAPMWGAAAGMPLVRR